MFFANILHYVCLFLNLFINSCLSNGWRNFDTNTVDRFGALWSVLKNIKIEIWTSLILFLLQCARHCNKNNIKLVEIKNYIYFLITVLLTLAFPLIFLLSHLFSHLFFCVAIIVSLPNIKRLHGFPLKKTLPGDYFQSLLILTLLTLSSEKKPIFAW